MKKIALLSFTKAGGQTGGRLEHLLRRDGFAAEHTGLKESGAGLSDWVERHFHKGNGLVFIGAAGIAVRAVAPYLKSKTTDPAVLVMDERSRFVVPLLSGHIGGANQLAERLAGYTGAAPVITTATDVNSLFAVDTWAVAQGLHIRNPERIKTVSAKILSGETVRISSEFPIAGSLPERVVGCGQGGADVRITCCVEADPAPLYLVPPALTVGIGCRKGTEQAAIRALFDSVLEAEGLDPRAVRQVGTIDLKAEEPGLLAFCADMGLPLRVFTAEQLRAVPGSFTASGFVQGVAGVDNVCERSAVLAGGETLLVRKRAKDGVTIAVARAAYELSFSELKGIEL